jgi:hypothetical protein
VDNQKTDEILNKRDHYVSRFLLKNFAITEGNKKSGLIYIYKKPAYKPKRGSILKHAGYDVDFYLGKNAETKQPDKVSDLVYKEIEKSKHAPAVIKKILSQSGDISLEYKEESILATLIAHQLTRTKKFRKTINRFLAFLLLNNYITKNDLGDKEKIQELIIKNKFNISPKQIENSFLANFFSLAGTRGQELFTAIQIAEHIVQAIYQKNFHTIIAPRNHYFIISDAPVCIIGKNDDLFKINKLWSFEKNDDYSFILPISSKKAIVFGNNYRSYKQINGKLAESLVIMINSLSINNTYEEFYCHTDKFWDDYKDFLITPKRLAVHRKISEEIKKHLTKRIIFFTKYLVWKIKNVFIKNKR